MAPGRTCAPEGKAEAKRSDGGCGERERAGQSFGARARAAGEYKSEAAGVGFRLGFSRPSQPAAAAIPRAIRPRTVVRVVRIGRCDGPARRAQRRDWSMAAAAAGAPRRGPGRWRRPAAGSVMRLRSPFFLHILMQ